MAVTEGYGTTHLHKAKVIQVIETVTAEGHGVGGDPVREVVQYWHPDGRLLATRDPIALSRGRQY